MIQRIITMAFLCAITQIALAQCSSLCTIELQNDGTTPSDFLVLADFTDIASGADIDIVAGQALTSLTGQSFDIIDEATGTCEKATDGTNDFTFDFVLEPYFDAYGGNTIATSATGNDAGHYIVHNNVGFQGSNVTNTNGSTTATSTGDVSCYNITVRFNNPEEAQDVNVNATSINTAGNTPNTAFETASIMFLDGSGAAYGTATYNGFWNGAPQGSNGGTNTTAINTEAGMYTTTGTGVFIAAEPGTVDMTIPTITTNGTSGANDSPTVNASADAGLNATDLVGGFVFRVCLEDVATTATDDIATTTSTSFTSTLNGFTICKELPCNANVGVFPW